MVIRAVAIVVALAAIAAVPAAAGCPDGMTPELLDGLPLADGFRTRTMGVDPPFELYRRALAEPGEVFLERDGKLGRAVLVAPVSVERFWRALNDDDHHDESGAIPLVASEVIGGEAASSGRRTFQYFRKAGIGRWWVNRLEMNAELYRTSGGRLWELSWRDAMGEYPGDEPPVAIEDRVPPLVETEGAWLLVPLGDECLLIEYTTRGEPGGLLGSMQFLVATRAVRNTMDGMLAMALEHDWTDHPDVRFVRPDGSPLPEVSAAPDGPGC